MDIGEGHIVNLSLAVDTLTKASIGLNNSVTGFHTFMEKLFADEKEKRGDYFKRLKTENDKFKTSIIKFGETSKKIQSLFDGITKESLDKASVIEKKASAVNPDESFKANLITKLEQIRADIAANVEKTNAAPLDGVFDSITSAITSGALPKETFAEISTKLSKLNTDMNRGEAYLGDGLIMIHDKLGEISDQIASTANTASFTTAHEEEERRRVIISDITDETMTKLNLMLTSIDRDRVQRHSKDAKPQDAGKGGGLVSLLGAVGGIAALAFAISLFTDIKVSDVLMMAAALLVLNISIRSLSSIPNKQLITTSIAMGIFSLAIIGMVYGLTELSAIPWEVLAKGVFVLGIVAFGLSSISALAPELLITSIALGIVSLSLLGMATALNMLGGIDWAGAGLFAVFIIGMTAALALLAPLIPIIAPVIGVIAALSAVFVVFAVGLNLVATALRILAPALPALSLFFREMMVVNPLQLAALAPGIVAFSASLGILSIALVAFGAAMAVGGILSKIGGLFGSLFPSDDMAKGERAVNLLNQIKATASGTNLGPVVSQVKDLAVAFNSFDEDKMEDATTELVRFGAASSRFTPQLQSLAYIRFSGLIQDMQSLSTTVPPVAAGFNALQASVKGVSLDGIASDMGQLVQNINRIETSKLAAIATSDISGFALGFKNLKTASENLSLSESISDTKKLVDTINDVSLLKVSALASIISSGKPIQMRVKTEVEASVKDKATDKNTTEGLAKIEDALSSFKSDSNERLEKLIDGFEMLADVIVKTTSQGSGGTVIAPSNTNVTSANTSVTISPSPLSPRQSAKNKEGLNSR